jgi:hypothetical protein
MWNLLLSINASNLIQRINRWRQSTMNAKDLVINDCREGEVVKYLTTVSPDLHRHEINRIEIHLRSRIYASIRRRIHTLE